MVDVLVHMRASTIEANTGGSSEEQLDMHQSIKLKRETGHGQTRDKVEEKTREIGTGGDVDGNTEGRRAGENKSKEK